MAGNHIPGKAHRFFLIAYAYPVLFGKHAENHGHDLLFQAVDDVGDGLVQFADGGQRRFAFALFEQSDGFFELIAYGSEYAVHGPGLW